MIPKYLSIIFLFFSLSFSMLSQTKVNEKIIYSGNTSLREISQKYLGNADHWYSIIKYNNYSSMNEIKAGAVLEIPVRQIKSTEQNINEIRKLITEATANGAEIFAKAELDSSIANLNIATYLSSNSAWDSALAKSEIAKSFISAANKKAMQMRNQMADATISDKEGTVEKRKSTSRQWKDAELYSSLYELDHARTLSKSYAEISFYDLSKFRLNENAQAVIQKSRVDLLKEKSNSSITLIQGDAFTKLVKDPGESLDISVPGLTTKINSKYFWIEKDKKSTKLANYDGEIAVGTKDSSVTVKVNQGTVVPDGGLPLTPINLLPYPALVTPFDGHLELKDSLVLAWEPVQDAHQYWVEICADPGANILLNTYKDIQSTSFILADIIPGTYFWRVTSIDENGLPGKFSTTRNFIVLKDTTKPYLTIHEPKDNIAVKINKIQISGETEAGVFLSINDKTRIDNSSGHFNFSYELLDGINDIIISATDKSGNKSLVSRRVTYEEDPKIEWNINSPQIVNDSIIYYNNSSISITGSTRPFSGLILKSGKNEITNTFAESSGFFKVNLVNAKSMEFIEIEIRTPAGYTSQKRYSLIFDNTPPLIELKNEFPSITNKSDITIIGSVEGATSFFIGNDIIKTNEGLFEYKLRLNEGLNNIDITASDEAGNITRLFRKIILDTVPPELITYNLSHASGDFSYSLTIKVNDANPVKKTAEVEVQTDSGTQTFYIHQQGISYIYKDQIVITDSRRIKIHKIVLEDYSGNKNELILTSGD